MHLVASYPIQADLLKPYYGQPILAVTHHGDTVAGVIDCVKDGHIIMKPLDYSAAQIQSAYTQPKLKKITKGKKGKRLVLVKDKGEKAKVNFFPGYGYPGFGYPGYGFGFGLGDGLGFAIPLILLASLFAFPGGFFF
jgi:hypothetical protein